MKTLNRTMYFIKKIEIEGKKRKKEKKNEKQEKRILQKKRIFVMNSKKVKEIATKQKEKNKKFFKYYRKRNEKLN